MASSGNIPHIYSDRAEVVAPSDWNAFMNKHFVDGKFRFGNYPTSYTEIEADGTIVHYGNATTWDDLLGDVTRVRTVGTGVSHNDTEGSVDYNTAANLSDYVIVGYQINHKWKQGSVLHPHLHFWQLNNNTPNILLQHRWQKNNAEKTTSWTNYAMKVLAFTYSGTVKNQIIMGTGITPPVGYGISDILQIKIIRDNANTSTLFAGADPHTGDIGITSGDIHIEQNKSGSRTQYAD